MHELVIRGATVVDGTGAPARTADVAVDQGRITDVGRAGAAMREVDADGLLLTPGFVDIHTHYDGQITWDPQLTPSSWHGVTTVVMGSCGVGFAPAAPSQRDWLIALMEGVEDIPGSALSEGIEWGWESFPEYLDFLASRPRAIDFAAQVPHGTVRAYVMGERGANNEAATGDDIEAMYRIVKAGLEAGAMGFSTSRTQLHKSSDGRVVPGTYAPRDELFGIGRALRDVGRGVFQLAAEHPRVPDELDWMEALATETGRPVMFNLQQFDQAPTLWREVLDRLDQAAAAGAPVFAQVPGRPIGILMSWQGTAHPFAAFPTWLSLAGQPWETQRAALADPAFRARLLADTPAPPGAFETFVTTSFQKMFPMDAQAEYEPAADQSVAATAAREGRAPREVAYDWLMRGEGTGMLYFPLYNFADGHLDALYEQHRHPRTVMGLSDGGAHCGAICDGGMPTFMLTHWTRDRKRGRRMPLEYVVHRQTQATARAMGMRDRGVIAPGMKADLNLIDYEHLGFDAPRMVFDLPAGGRRLVQRARGYKATWCAGQRVIADDEPTGALPGRLVRSR